MDINTQYVLTTHTDITHVYFSLDITFVFDNPSMEYAYNINIVTKSSKFDFQCTHSLHALDQQLKVCTS